MQPMTEAIKIEKVADSDHTCALHARDDIRPTPAREPNWPISLALLTAWILPRTTARRTLTAPLWKAWLVHVVAGMAVLAIITSTAILVEAPALTFSDFFAEVGRTCQNTLAEFARNPIEFSLSILGFVLLFEAINLAVATVTVPWGAVDEPLKNSYRHAIRQVWLRSAHAVPIVGTVAGAIALLHYLEVSWEVEHISPMLPTYTVPAALDPIGSQLGRTANAIAGNVISNQLWQTRPWYLKREEMIFVPLICSCIFWFIWGMLRAVAVPRPHTTIPRQPTCEWCGYDLMTLSNDARCPECGRNVIDSLDPAARPGPPWTSTRRGMLRRWFATWTTALFRPTDFSYSLRIRNERSHLAFTGFHLPLVFIIAATSVPTFILMKELQQKIDPGSTLGAPSMSIEVFTVGMPIFGTLCTGAAIGIILVVASFAGFEASGREKRNLLPIAMEAACYLVPFLILWEIFGSLTGMAAFWFADSSWLRNIYNTRGIDPNLVAWVMWIVPNGFLVLLYVFTVRKITHAARYSNK